MDLWNWDLGNKTGEEGLQKGWKGKRRTYWLRKLRAGRRRESDAHARVAAQRSVPDQGPRKGRKIDLKC